MKKIGYICLALFWISTGFLWGCRDESAALYLENGQDDETAAETADEQETENESTEEEAVESDSEAEQDTEEICVYVCGAVQHPGVYYLLSGDRIYQAIEAAGGFTEEADSNYLNQAEPLADGSQIQIPTKEEAKELRASGVADTKSQEESTSDVQSKVNINTAAEEELMTLPGIGEARAAAIIQYRDANGKFKTIEELKEISGIKGKVFEKIQELISV